MNTKRFTLIVLMLLIITSIIGYAPAAAQAPKGVPDGCDHLNERYYDYSYWGATTSLLVFEAGDLIIINAWPLPDTIGSPEISLAINNIVVDTANVPGKLVYEFAHHTLAVVRWGNSELAGLDWDVVCKD